MLALLLLGAFTLQDPAPAEKPPEKPPAEQPPAEQPAAEKPAAAAPAAKPKPVEAWDDKTAKARLADFEKRCKGSPSLAERNQALDELAAGAHKSLVKVLVRVVETDKAVLIKKRAVELLGNQPRDVANPAIRKLLASGAANSNPPVQAELVRALARCGYESKQWKDVEELFESDYDNARIPVHEAILDLVIEHKEKAALPLLLRNFDEPSADNVHDASNPPAEYWKARWHAWAAWKGKVKAALTAITGQTFSSAAEAKAWLAKNLRK